MTAAERLRQLAGVSGTAAALLLAIGAGASTGAALVDYSGLPTATAAEHLLVEREQEDSISPGSLAPLNAALPRKWGPPAGWGPTQRIDTGDLPDASNVADSIAHDPAALVAPALASGGDQPRGSDSPASLGGDAGAGGGDLAALAVAVNESGESLHADTEKAKAALIADDEALALILILMEVS